MKFMEVFFIGEIVGAVFNVVNHLFINAKEMRSKNK